MKKIEKIILFCILLIFSFLYLQNNRYMVRDGMVIDKWTKKCYYYVDEKGKMELCKRKTIQAE